MKKLLVIGIIALFIGFAFIPRFNAVSIEKTSPSWSEISTNGSFIKITRILPYLDVLGPFYVVLYFIAEIKNIGDEPYIGDVGYSATAKNIHGKIVKTSHVTLSEGLNPNESWIDRFSGYGLKFDGWYYPARYYKLEFFSIPSNDYKMAKYKIYGDWHGYEYEQVNYSFPDTSPNNIYNPLLEQLQIPNFLLQRFKIL